MSDVIQLLPDHVANQIAAGEVVQRPASVVKELLENAIDARATRIHLLIKDAGKTLVQVSDNGQGMSTTDARLSFERHATSKIRAAEDLFRLNTKGFRGEALASIAAIAHVELKSRKKGDEVGTQLIIKGSQVEAQEPCVTAQGTVVSVKNLFFNIPARRNFLKSDAVETRHIIDEFQRVALAHPAIAFTMHHNGSELFHLPQENLRQRIVSVFGAKTNEKLVPVEEETELVKISGFIGKPEYARKTKGEQFFFVNHRFIKSAYLHHAVSAAFEGLLEDKRYPSYFLFLEVDPHSIDINIHPTKTEIKFDEEHAIYAILRSAVKHSLGQFNVSPTLDFSRNADLDTPYAYKNKPPEAPRIEIDRNFNPFEKGEGQGGSFRPIYPKGRPGENEWKALYTGLDSKTEPEFSSVQFESEAVTGSLFGNEVGNSQSGIFQLKRKFIISSLKSGLLVIHQHRAHYRILYEEFLKNITVEAKLSQQLLFPLVLHLSGPEMRLLKEIKPSLEQTGFDFEELEEGKAKINGIPGGLSEGEVEKVLTDLLTDLEQEIPDTGFSNVGFLARSLAKHAAVKTGANLNPEEQLSLINRLFACKDPQTTPDHETVYIRLSTDDLDKKFCRCQESPIR